MQLVNIGFGNIVSAERIVAIVSPESAPIKRLIQESKDEKTGVDATYGRRTRAVVIMDSGHVILSAIQPETVAGRVEKEEIDNISLDRNDYFYLPAKILHIDGDKDYLEKCLNYYKQKGVFAVGKKVVEEHIYESILPLLKEYKPDIVIITGHDAYYPKKGNINDIKNYRNSANFIKAINVARKYEKSHDKLVIIAGACQSNYEELIKAGANFASSPKRVNIHALDPAIIATTLATTERNKEINLLELLDKTKYGESGMGGIKSNGLMYVGYPR